MGEACPSPGLHSPLQAGSMAQGRATVFRPGSRWLPLLVAKAMPSGCPLYFGILLCSPGADPLPAQQPQPWKSPWLSPSTGAALSVGQCPARAPECWMCPGEPPRPVLTGSWTPSSLEHCGFSSAEIQPFLECGIPRRGIPLPPPPSEGSGLPVSPGPQQCPGVAPPGAGGHQQCPSLVPTGEGGRLLDSSPVLAPGCSFLVSGCVC